MQISDMAKRLHELIEQICERFPPNETAEMKIGEEVKELISVGEPGIALENLCTQLYEYDVPLRREEVNLLATLGSEMHLDPKYWHRLEALITEPGENE